MGQTSFPRISRSNRYFHSPASPSFDSARLRASSRSRGATRSRVQLSPSSSRPSQTSTSTFRASHSHPTASHPKANAGKAMFKGLAKRPVSLGPASRDQDGAGKENRPRSVAVSKNARRVSVFHDSHGNRDGRASDAQKGAQNKPQKVQPPKPAADSSEMESAFDKLLVSPVITP